MRIKIRDREFELHPKLPSRYLPRLARTAVRFTVVGLMGMFIQTWFFELSLMMFDNPGKGAALYFVAFTMGYIFEMIPNYILSNWYTFGTRPKWKNAGGFVLARVINFTLQIILLPIFIELLPKWPDEYISYLVIVLGGVVNYLMCLFFFKNKKK